jgi:hypothetical protein
LDAVFPFGKVLRISVNRSWTFEKVMKLIRAVMDDFEVDFQLIFNGKVLSDSSSCKDEGIETGSMLRIFFLLQG